jgi:hypothetical protein
VTQTKQPPENPGAVQLGLSPTRPVSTRFLSRHYRPAQAPRSCGSRN